MFMYPNLCVLKVVDHPDHTVFGRFAISGHAHIISGWWYTYPFEKHESQLGLLFPIEWTNNTCSKPPTNYCWLNIQLLRVLS